MSNADQESRHQSNANETRDTAGASENRRINDKFRSTLMCGQVKITQPVQALGIDALSPS